MTRTEIIALARMRLGFNNALLQSYFTQSLDAVQQMYETSEGRFPLPWFLFDSTATVAVVGAVRTVNVPTGYLGFDERWVPTLVNGTLEYEIQHKMQRDLAPFVAEIGRPTYFAFDGLKMHLYAMPDKAYTLKVPCYKSSAVLSASETSAWYTYFPNLILEELIVMLARSTRDEGAIKMSTVSREQDNYRIRCEAMKHQLMDYVMGGPDPIGVNDGT